MLLLLSADIFQNLLFIKKLFQKHYQIVKRLGPQIRMENVSPVLDQIRLTLMVFLKEIFQKL